MWRPSDERLLPIGTAYITDVGMCGGRISILVRFEGKGHRKAASRDCPNRFCQRPRKNELHGVLLRSGKRREKWRKLPVYNK
jgi:calcineurin-like phosphoesterase